MGVRHQSPGVEAEAGLLEGLAHRRLAGSRLLGVGRQVVGVGVGRIDPTAREHPHPAERAALVAAQEKGLQTGLAVAEDDDGGGGDGRR